MTIELRGSGPVAAIIGATAVHAKANTPHTRFAGSNTKTTLFEVDSDSGEEDESSLPLFDVTPTAPSVADLSTQAWLLQLQLEKRIATPQATRNTLGTPLATPSSVYGNASSAEDAQDGFSARG